MPHAVTIRATPKHAPAAFTEDSRAEIFAALQTQASYMAALEHTAARAIETGDIRGVLEDIERIAGGIKESLRELAAVIIEMDAPAPLSLVKEDRHALAQN